MAAALYAGPPSGGDFVITGSTVDGGGGTVADGNFELTGTIGQPDASTGPSIGNDYALAGGFWAQISLIANLIFQHGFEEPLPGS